MRTKLGMAGVLATVVTAVALGGSASADPANPTFAVGDGSAAIGAHVTFWGAQWAKDNTVSGGRAPAAFKGFATGVDTSTCSFTSGPGNSVDPPASLPAGDLLALVVSSVTKSGSSISGTYTAVAVIQPDPGYAGNPGHAGTGVVVGTTACSGGFLF